VAVRPPAFAHEGQSELIEELVVYGRAQQLISIAGASSEGIVGYDDLELPALLRVGELVESVPGMVATQHSGTGKANQYFLRVSAGAGTASSCGSMRSICWIRTTVTSATCLRRVSRASRQTGSRTCTSIRSSRAQYAPR